MTGIYKITNKLNEKSYIGQSIHCGRRLDEHCKGDQLIDQTIQMEGIQNFNFEILKEVNKNELSYWEDYYIIKYNTMFPNGYNKRWNCSEDLRKILVFALENDNIEQNQKKEIIKEDNIIKQKQYWEDEILTDNELNKIYYYDKNFGNKYGFKENFLGSIEGYKKYKYLRRKNSIERKKINMQFPKIKTKDKYFTQIEYSYFKVLQNILKGYNEGINLWKIEREEIWTKNEELNLCENGLYTEWFSYGNDFSYKYEKDKIIIKTLNKKKIDKFLDMIELLLKRKDFDSSNFYYFYKDKEISYEEAQQKRFRNIIIEIRANS